MGSLTGGTGFKMNKTAMELNNGLTVQLTRVNTSRERNTDKENSCGQMAPFSKVNSPIIIKLMGIMSEMTAGDTLGPGKTTKCTDKAYSPGSMGGNTKVSIKRTKRRALEYLSGQTGGNMRGNE